MVMEERFPCVGLAYDTEDGGNYITFERELSSKERRNVTRIVQECSGRNSLWADNSTICILNGRETD
jgi:hypothetical protein